MRAHEEGKWVAERRGKYVGRAVEDRAWAAPRDRGHVESLGAPVGASGERGIALEFDGEEARGPVVSEAGKRVRVCIGIGLRQWAAVPEDETSV